MRFNCGRVGPFLIPTGKFVKSWDVLLIQEGQTHTNDKLKEVRGGHLLNVAGSTQHFRSNAIFLNKHLEVLTLHGKKSKISGRVSSCQIILSDIKLIFGMPAPHSDASDEEYFDALESLEDAVVKAR